MADLELDDDLSCASSTDDEQETDWLGSNTTTTTTSSTTPSKYSTRDDPTTSYHHHHHHPRSRRTLQQRPESRSLRSSTARTTFLYDNNEDLQHHQQHPTVHSSFHNHPTSHRIPEVPEEEQEEEEEEAEERDYPSVGKARTASTEESHSCSPPTPRFDILEKYRFTDQCSRRRESLEEEARLKNGRNKDRAREEDEEEMGSGGDGTVEVMEECVEVYPEEEEVGVYHNGFDVRDNRLNGCGLLGEQSPGETEEVRQSRFLRRTGRTTRIAMEREGGRSLIGNGDGMVQDEDKKDDEENDKEDSFISYESGGDGAETEEASVELNPLDNRHKPHEMDDGDDDDDDDDDCLSYGSASTVEREKDKEEESDDGCPPTPYMDICDKYRNVNFPEVEEEEEEKEKKKSVPTERCENIVPRSLCINAVCEVEEEEKEEKDIEEEEQIEEEEEEEKYVANDEHDNEQTVQRGDGAEKVTEQQVETKPFESHPPESIPLETNRESNHPPITTDTPQPTSDEFDVDAKGDAALESLKKAFACADAKLGALSADILLDGPTSSSAYHDLEQEDDNDYDKIVPHPSFLSPPFWIPKKGCGGEEEEDEGTNVDGVGPLPVSSLSSATRDTTAAMTTPVESKECNDTTLGQTPMSETLGPYDTDIGSAVRPNPALWYRTTEEAKVEALDVDPLREEMGGDGMEEADVRVKLFSTETGMAASPLDGERGGGGKEKVSSAFSDVPSSSEVDNEKVFDERPKEDNVIDNDGKDDPMFDNVDKEIEPLTHSEDEDKDDDGDGEEEGVATNTVPIDSIDDFDQNGDGEEKEEEEDQRVVDTFPSSLSTTDDIYTSAPVTTPTRNDKKEEDERPIFPRPVEGTSSFTDHLPSPMPSPVRQCSGDSPRRRELVEENEDDRRGLLCKDDDDDEEERCNQLRNDLHRPEVTDMFELRRCNDEEDVYEDDDDEAFLPNRESAVTAGPAPVPRRTRPLVSSMSPNRTGGKSVSFEMLESTDNTEDAKKKMKTKKQRVSTSRSSVGGRTVRVGVARPRSQLVSRRSKVVKERKSDAAVKTFLKRKEDILSPLPKMRKSSRKGIDGELLLVRLTKDTCNSAEKKRKTRSLTDRPVARTLEPVIASSSPRKLTVSKGPRLRTEAKRGSRRYSNLGKRGTEDEDINDDSIIEVNSSAESSKTFKRRAVSVPPRDPKLIRSTRRYSSSLNQRREPTPTPSTTTCSSRRSLTVPKGPKLLTSTKNGNRRYSSVGPSPKTTAPSSPDPIEAAAAKLRRCSIGAPNLRTQSMHGDRVYSSVGRRGSPEPSERCDSQNSSPQKVPRALTVPKGPNLRTQFKLGDRKYSSRGRRDRDEAIVEVAIKESDWKDRKPTIPRAPKLSQARVKTCRGSSAAENENKENTDNSNAVPFKAKPIGSGVISRHTKGAGGYLGVPKIAKRKATSPKPFRLSDTKVRSTDDEQQEKKPPSTTFRARPMPTDISNKASSPTAKRRLTTTTPIPFRFRTEEREKKVHNDEKDQDDSKPKTKNAPTPAHFTFEIPKQRLKSMVTRKSVASLVNSKRSSFGATSSLLPRPPPPSNNKPRTTTVPKPFCLRSSERSSPTKPPVNDVPKTSFRARPLPKRTSEPRIPVAPQRPTAPTEERNDTKTASTHMFRARPMPSFSKKTTASRRLTSQPRPSSTSSRSLPVSSKSPTKSPVRKLSRTPTTNSSSPKSPRTSATRLRSAIYSRAASNLTSPPDTKALKTMVANMKISARSRSKRMEAAELLVRKAEQMRKEMVDDDSADVVEEARIVEENGVVDAMEEEEEVVVEEHEEEAHSDDVVVDVAE